MELLNVVTARSVWLFDVAELNPRGISVFPDLFEWVKDSYQFEKSPKSLEDVDQTKALVFSGGSYRPEGETFIHVGELKLYNDGMVANSQSSTRDTDSFLEEVLTSAAREFNLRYRPEIIRKKLYLSELNVMSEKNLGALNPKLDEFANKIGGSSGHKFEFSGISFWPRQGIPPTVISAFTLERKANTDRDEHKYFSRAPIHTDEHIKLLNEIESTIMS